MFYKAFNIMGTSEEKKHNFARFIFLAIGFCLLNNIQATVLGMIKINSGINEPFKATIPVSQSAYISKLKVKLASNATFNAKGILKEDFLDRITVKMINGNKKRIEISSKSPIFSSFFIILLDVEQSNTKSTYSALIDFDGSSPMASLIFNTNIMEDSVGTTQVAKDITDSSKPNREIDENIDTSKEKIASINNNTLYDSELAPEDSTIFKSELYRDILNKSTNPIQDIYVPDDKLSATEQKKPRPVPIYFKQQEGNKNDKPEKNNQELLSKKGRNISQNNNSFKIAMGNSSFNNEVHIAGYSPSAKKNGFASELNMKILWVLLAGLFMFLGSLFYNTYKRRKELQTVFLGDFDKISSVSSRRTYSKSFHKNLKKLLNNGEFNEATQLFRNEFVKRGMSLYEICQYSRTFQEFGITELTTEMFIGEENRIVDNNKKVRNSNENKSQTPLHEGDSNINVSTKKNYTGNKSKKSKSKTMLYDSLDLSEVADDIMTAKLNLASAYISMGDFVKSQNILNEVCQYGNAQQVKEAKRMLKKFNK